MPARALPGVKRRAQAVFEQAAAELLGLAVELGR
jgi:hypothetical protein